MKTTIDKEFFERWKDKKVVMCCKTKEEAVEFCKIMHENGLKWWNGSSYKDSTYWDHMCWLSDDRDTMCYNFNSGVWGYAQEYKNKGYEILEFSDYIFNEKRLANKDKDYESMNISDIRQYLDNTREEKLQKTQQRLEEISKYHWQYDCSDWRISEINNFLSEVNKIDFILNRLRA